MAATQMDSMIILLPDLDFEYMIPLFLRMEISLSSIQRIVPTGKGDHCAKHDPPDVSGNLRQKEGRIKASVKETGQTLHIITIKNL